MAQAHLSRVPLPCASGGAGACKSSHGHGPIASWSEITGCRTSARHGQADDGQCEMRFRPGRIRRVCPGPKGRHRHRHRHRRRQRQRQIVSQWADGRAWEPSSRVCGRFEDDAVAAGDVVPSERSRAADGEQPAARDGEREQQCEWESGRRAACGMMEKSSERWTAAGRRHRGHCRSLRPGNVRSNHVRLSTLLAPESAGHCD